MLARSALVLAAFVLAASASAQRKSDRKDDLYDQLRAKMYVSLSPHLADLGTNNKLFVSDKDVRWLAKMHNRLLRILPKNSVLRDRRASIDFLRTVQYESLRAGLDPQWVLAVIQVESAFRKYAISSAGASGFMQVMPFWVDLIGARHHNLFDMRTNLRYGTTILRHYLTIENGDYFRALGRYNGSLGIAKYPNLVLNSWQKNWRL